VTLKDEWWKLILSIAGAAILFLLHQNQQFLEKELDRNKVQNSAQWRTSAEVERSLVREIAALKEKVAFIDGYHAGLRESKVTTKK